MRPATKHQNLASSIRRRRRRRHNPGGRGRRRSGTIPHRRTGRAVKRSHVALSPRGDVPAIPRPVPFGPYLTALGLAADTGPGPNRAQSIAFYRFKSNRRWGWLGRLPQVELGYCLECERMAAMAMLGPLKRPCPCSARPALADSEVSRKRRRFCVAQMRASERESDLGDDCNEEQFLSFISVRILLL